MGEAKNGLFPKIKPDQHTRQGRHKKKQRRIDADGVVDIKAGAKPRGAPVDRGALDAPPQNDANGHDEAEDQPRYADDLFAHLIKRARSTWIKHQPQMK